MSALSDLVERRMEELGIASIRELARRAQRHPGGALDHSTIAAYARGAHGRPSRRTIDCLAFVLDLDVASVRAAADEPEPDSGFVLPPEAARLSPRQRRAVVELIRSMVDHGEHHGVPCGRERDECG